MAEANPLIVIARCIEQCTATADRQQIARCLADALAELQIDNTETDAFQMLGNAIADTASKQKDRSAAMLQVWLQLDARRLSR